MNHHILIHWMLFWSHPNLNHRMLLLNHCMPSHWVPFLNHHNLTDGVLYWTSIHWMFFLDQHNLKHGVLFLNLCAANPWRTNHCVLGHLPLQGLVYASLDVWWTHSRTTPGVCCSSSASHATVQSTQSHVQLLQIVTNSESCSEVWTASGTLCVPLHSVIVTHHM